MALTNLFASNTIPGLSEQSQITPRPSNDNAQELGLRFMLVSTRPGNDHLHESQAIMLSGTQDRGWAYSDNPHKSSHMSSSYDFKGENI